MADNAKVSQISSGGAKITIIDPNPPGSRIIPSEDLFIYVSLRIRPKNRSVIELTDTGANLSGEEGVEINLIGTQVDSSNGNQEYMSTDWTNIGGNINGSVTGTKNKESFGIKNINITYGADLLPRVNITFLDVRGASLFDGFEHTDEKGVKSNVSNYSSFFRMPYPIFELTIKGYYGKAVKYCLNMIKWSGNFNEGNFEIKAEFIGYSTSFLSDIIMDHVRAVVDTDDGYSELVNVYNKNSRGKAPTTINQLLENVGNINKYVTDIKSNDNNKGDEVGYNTLVQLNGALSKLSVIKAKVGDPIGVDNQDNSNYFNLEGPYIKYNGLTPRTNIFAFRDVQLLTEDAVNKYYINFRKDLITTIKTYEKELPAEFSEYSITKKSGKKLEDFIPTTTTSETAYTLVPIIDNLLKSRDVGYSKSSEFKKPPYDFTASTINNGLGPEVKSQYFDYFNVRKTINELYDTLTNKRQEYADKVSENINKSIDKKITFNPSIGNIFEVLCNNIEAYLNVIYKTAINAESKNSDRITTLKGKITDTSSEKIGGSGNNKDRIYAWPMLYKNNGDEIYLGEDNKVSENEQFFPEIKYIENLASSLVKENKKNNNNPSLKSQNVTFPINLADVTSVYDAYSVTNFSAPQKTSLINRIITRALITYDYSNFKDKINDFANLEAAALYELTVDQITKDAITNFLSEGSSSLLSRSEQSKFITKSGSTYYANNNLNLNEGYSDIASFVTGSTTLFFDIGEVAGNNITGELLTQAEGNTLFQKVKTALGDNKDVVQYFTPTNQENTTFNTNFYSIEEDITSSCWEESVLDGNKKIVISKLGEYVGKVKSNYSEKEYTLNQSVSYTSFTSNTLSTLSLNPNMITVDEIKSILILATYPFKPISEFLSKLKDKSKIVDVPYSYLAWIGAHMKRQQIMNIYGYDILDLWTNVENEEFASNQVSGVNNYINISHKIKNSGELPTPFNDFNLFNRNIQTKFIDVFNQWVKDVKTGGLIDFFNIPTFNQNEFIKILTKIDKTNNKYRFISYTPNFWNLKNDSNFKIDESVISNFLNIFGQKFSTLNQNAPKIKTNNMTPRTVTDNNIKQSIYKTTKNLYDKWIGGTINGKPHNACGGYDSDVNKSIFSYFRFINKDYSDISDIARIDLNSLLVMSNLTNVSFLEVVSRILRDNNFLFLPLPIYIDYTKREEIDSIFTPFTKIEKVNGSPTFVAMYNSGNSKFLDLGKNYQYTNDSYDFVDNGSLPESVTSSNNGTKSIVAFRVAFGDENQSIFKNITINQEDFTETEESLRATSDLIDKKGGTQRTFKGTNLYNVYSLRSYNVNFEMMGNPMIQPLMYLQLDNIPMFHGAYSVINISHDITPNTMKTRVKAVRKSKYSVPIVTNVTTFLPLDLNKNLKITNNISVISASDVVDNVIEDNTLSGYKRPIEGNIFITSKKGFRINRQHQGVDIRVAENTPMIASWSGIVNRLFNSTGYGLYVILDHSNGTDKPFDDGYFYYTLYGHLNSVDVADKTQVKSGQPFAKSGGVVGNPNSGNSGGPHLHYEIRRSRTKLTDVRNGYYQLKNENILDPEVFINYKFPNVESTDGDQNHDQLPPFGGAI